MKSFWVSLPLLLLGCVISAVNAQELIVIDPWVAKSINEPFPQQYVLVGDTILFVWPDTEEQSVWIYPSLVCFDETNRRFVGNLNATNYTFTEDDGSPTGNTLLFTSDIDDYCFRQGMRLRVTVYSGTDTLPPFVLPPTIATTAPAPVASPVVVVTDTDSPTTGATDALTVAPTTNAPSATPVAAPTLPPVAPTLGPTTLPPVVATETPSLTPTAAATDATTAPTAVVTTTTTAPTSVSSSKNVTLRGLQMELFGINTFGTNTQQSWVLTTAQYNTKYVQEQMDGIVFSFQTLYEITGSTIVLSPQNGSGRRLRNLQQTDISGDSVKITYSQTLIYETTDPSITPNMLSTEPFDTEEKRALYVEFLRNFADNLALSRVVSSTAVTTASPTAPTISPGTMPPNTLPTQSPVQPDNNKSAILSLPAIIGIACGGGALLILFVIFCLYCRGGGGGKTKKTSKTSSVSSKSPPISVSVNRDDDVSTLHDPKQMNGHGGDQSIATVDYDYSKAYGAGDHSVSSAGGTLGDRTDNVSSVDPSHAAAGGAALGPFDDDASFENHYRTPGSTDKEEILHVFAPPGKLGVVIDTPDNGAPLVHAVKETSVIYGRVQVGDKLVAVDDEDCRTMTAVKVSKLISRKSANPSRKLTIVRTTTID